MYKRPDDTAMTPSVVPKRSPAKESSLSSSRTHSRPARFNSFSTESSVSDTRCWSHPHRKRARDLVPGQGRGHLAVKNPRQLRHSAQSPAFL